MSFFFASLKTWTVFVQDEEHDGLGMSRDEVRRVLLRFPRLSSYPLETIVRPRVALLRSKMGFGTYAHEEDEPFDSVRWGDDESCDHENEEDDEEEDDDDDDELVDNMERAQIVAMLESARSERSSLLKALNSAVVTKKRRNAAEEREATPGRQVARVLCMAPQLLGINLEKKFEALEVFSCFCSFQ